MIFPIYEAKHNRVVAHSAPTTKRPTQCHVSVNLELVQSLGRNGTGAWLEETQA